VKIKGKAYVCKRGVSAAFPQTPFRSVGWSSIQEEEESDEGGRILVVLAVAALGLGLFSATAIAGNKKKTAVVYFSAIRSSTAAAR